MKRTNILATLGIAWLLSAGTSFHQTNAAILFQDDSFADVESGGLVLDFLDQATGNITIQFGSTLGEFIQWNATDLRFEISDDIDLNSNQIVEARVENVTAMPGGALGLGVGGTGRIVQLTAVDSIAPGCTGPNCQPGTYAWSGTTWIGLTGTTNVSNATKVVTVGPVGRDYTTIADAATYLNTVSAGIMLVDPGTFSITTAIDLENIEIVGKGNNLTTIDISAAGSLQIINSAFKDLTIDVDSGIAATSGLDVQQNGSYDSAINFQRVDFVVGSGKVAIDSTAGTPPVTDIDFINSTQSGGAGNLLLSVSSSGLDNTSTILVDDQLGVNPLRIADWDVTIIGGGNVLTSGTISTVPDRTIYVSPGMNIQGAIDSLGSSGGTIKLLIGTHSITAPLIITSNDITLVGEGSGTILSTTSGSWTGGTGENNATIQVGVSNGTAPVSNITIQNFQMEVGANTHGISINGGSENKVMDMVVTSTGAKTSTHTAIVFTDGSATIGERFTATRNIINNSAPANRWVDGIHFDGNADFAGQLFGYGNGIQDSIISENIVSEAAETSYAFSQVSASSVFSNRARNLAFSPTAFGMFFNDCADVIIINNTVEGANATATGISLFDNVDNTSVIGNAVRGGPSSFSIGIANNAATNAGNIIADNQFSSVTTTIVDAGTNAKLETNHHRATANPTVNDDINDGYDVGTFWINTATNLTFINVDSTAGAASWVAVDYRFAVSTPPATCNASFAGQTFMDTDSGIVYVCDTSNGRNKWLSTQDNVIFGEQSGNCGAGDSPGNEDGCAVDWGSSLGPDNATNVGFYIPHDITVTGFGFSADNDSCFFGSFDVEVWSTGSSSDDNNYSFDTNIATGLTGQAHNANNLNIDIDGGQYILWGIDNNCTQTIDDWNVVLYYRTHHT
ncbi:MAG: hypothetical protein R3B71_03825 [Candidatus Gracilibacteria bacterium]|nr:hypothetical protein [Candidatus Peregrinibacteria bacterium]